MNYIIIGSDNGLSPIQRQAIIQDNAVLLSVDILGTFSFDILIKSQILSWIKMHMRVSSAKWPQFFLGLIVLGSQIFCLFLSYYYLLQTLRALYYTTWSWIA